MINLVEYLPSWFEETSVTALLMFGLLAATLYYVGRYGLKRVDSKRKKVT